MFMDALGLVSDAQAVSATGFSTNTIDLTAGAAARAIGTGESVGFGLAVDVALAGTTPTFSVDVVQSDNANLSTPDVLSSTTLTAAQLAAGAAHFVQVPPGQPTKRYLGLRYNLGGTTPTITVTAWLTTAKLFSFPTPKNYAKGYAI